MDEAVKTFIAIHGEGGASLLRTEALLPKVLRSMDNLLLDRGAHEVVAPIREAIRQGDVFEHGFGQVLVDINRKYDGVLERKELWNDVIDVLNATPGARAIHPLAQAVAQELREKFFNPILLEARKRPELAEIIGEVGFIEDYFPQMMQAWQRAMKRAGAKADSEDIWDLMRDLMPDQHKAPYVKTREGFIWISSQLPTC